MTLPVGTDKPAPSRFDPLFWVAPFVAVLAVVPIGVIDMFLFGLAAMAADGCNTGEPCPAADEVAATYHFAVVSTIVGLVVTTLLPLRRLRALRWTVAGITIACAGWPALWIATGHPRL